MGFPKPVPSEAIDRQIFLFLPNRCGLPRPKVPFQVDTADRGGVAVENPPNGIDRAEHPTADAQPRWDRFVETDPLAATVVDSPIAQPGAAGRDQELP